jgi:hypothetical protein
MTIEQVDDKPVRIDICCINFSEGYAQQYTEFLKVLYQTINPTDVYLVYPSGMEIRLQSVDTFERFCEIVDRISCIYNDTEQFFS